MTTTTTITAQLFSLRDCFTDADEMRTRIKATGATIARETIQKTTNHGDAVRFHIIAQDDADASPCYWVAVWSPLGYRLQKTRTGCTCAQSLCNCPEYRQRLANKGITYGAPESR